MRSNWQETHPNFDQTSYYAGITAAFAEVVAAGVKQLALSSPYTAAELATMLPITEQIAAEYGVVLFAEDDLLVTPLFPADIAAGKHVILLAQSKQVLVAYHALKRQRAEMVANGRYHHEAHQLARAFGRLLSYSDERVTALLQT